MACATTTPTFSFHRTATPHSRPKLISFSTSRKPHFVPRSIDVSKDDKPTPNQAAEPVVKDSPDPPAGEVLFDKRRLEEKFAVLNTGVYECRSCGYKYDESAGDPSYPVPPGLPFDSLPEDWRCPTCGAARTFFVSKSVEIAGFAQNQQFGLGANTLTSGQKAALIYGSLLFFFALFLSGYFLQ
uniref:Rubredoxin-like domain-containing protein n=1 Tax=Kalanchoe fedtschenkoi TaxID=63787 RepID=A0A7N0UJ86_KALFE